MRNVTGRCGTSAGYERHRRAGTPKCQPCKDVHTAAANAAKQRRAAAGRPCGACGKTVQIIADGLLFRDHDGPNGTLCLGSGTRAPTLAEMTP